MLTVSEITEYARSTAENDVYAYLTMAPDPMGQGCPLRLDYRAVQFGLGSLLGEGLRGISGTLDLSTGSITGAPTYERVIVSVYSFPRTSIRLYFITNNDLNTYRQVRVESVEQTEVPNGGLRLVGRGNDGTQYTLSITKSVRPGPSVVR